MVTHARACCGSGCLCDGCRPGTHAGLYTVRDTGDMLAQVALSGEAEKVETNDAEMSALGILCSSNRDLQGDIIEVDGVSLEMHRYNPIVLWDHAKQYSLPIGRAEDQEGAYYVIKNPAAGIITCKTFFAPRPADLAPGNPWLPTQVYSMIRGRFIRAMSIAVKDIEVDELEPDPERGLFPKKNSQGQRVPFKWIKRSLLAEATWTPLPANPDAVMSLMDRGRLDVGGFRDEELDPLIRKSFEPLLPERRAWANGLTTKSLKGGHTVPENNNSDRPTDHWGNEDVDDKADDVAREMEHPPGAVAVTDLHDGYKALHDLAGEHSKRVEHPGVREHLADHMDKLKSMMGECKDLHEKEYGHLEPLAGGEDDGEAAEGQQETPHQPTEEVQSKRLKKKAIATNRTKSAATVTTKKAADPIEEALDRTLEREKAKFYEALSMLGEQQ